MVNLNDVFKVMDDLYGVEFTLGDEWTVYTPYCLHYPEAIDTTCRENDGTAEASERYPVNRKEEM